MEDLLDEKDFTQIEKIPTPYRYYGIFMVVAVLEVLLYFALYIIAKRIKNTNFTLSVMFIDTVLPLATVLMMFFWRKKFLALNFRQTALGIFILMLTYLSATVVTKIIDPYKNTVYDGQHWNWEGFTGTLVFYAIQFVVCLLIMIVIAEISSRKHKQQRLR